MAAGSTARRVNSPKRGTRKGSARQSSTSARQDPARRSSTKRGARQAPPKRRSGGSGAAADGDSLADYRAKRDPARTPEPVPDRTRRRSGAAAAGRPTTTPRRGGRRGATRPAFVVQEHHARSLHWDFRLERDGVLVSWAVPKGLPPDPDAKRLAVHTEDHPLEYAAFHGTIPEGEYGAGTVEIWDEGWYECERWSPREVKVVLHGRRASGRYVLFQTDGRRWMLHRMDPAAEAQDPMPETLAPMLAELGDLPRERQGWAYEYKWDGVRAVAFVDGGRLRLRSRTGHDMTARYPELRELGEALGSRPAVLDGEIVALDDAGRPSFRALQPRMHVEGAARIRRLRSEVPVTYMLFDVVYLDGRSLLAAPYRERRAALVGLELEGPSWTTPPAHDGPGADVLRAAGEAGLEGVVAKRVDAPYRPGRRNGDWVKVKCFRTQEVVVGGWTAGEGRRSGGIGALLLGLPAEKGDAGRLTYIGKVGTGFTDAMLRDLGARLKEQERPGSPFTTQLPRADQVGVRWAKPAIVGEVRFAEWTRDGRMRHPSWRGLRPDKRAREVRREQ